MNTYETASSDRQKLITLIVPVFNREKFLPDFFTGLERQTCNGLEIIFIDDGSTDRSIEMLNVFRDSHPEWIVRIITQPNRGVSAARNKGLDLAQGEWIAFADSDDCLDPEFFSKMVSAADGDVDLVVCHERAVPYDWTPEEAGCSIKKEKETTDTRVESGVKLMVHFHDPFPGLVTWCWNKLYRKELIGTTRFDEGRIIEDVGFNCEVFSRAGKVVWISDKLYNYRLHPESYCHVRGASFYEDYRWALRRQNQIMKQLGDAKLYTEDLYFCLANLIRFEVEAEMYGHKEQAAELRREYIEFYTKARGRLRGSKGVKAFMYRYMGGICRHLLRIKIRATIERSRALAGPSRCPKVKNGHP